MVYIGKIKVVVGKCQLADVAVVLSSSVFYIFVWLLTNG